MVNYVFDEIVAAADLMAIEVMAVVGFFFEEAEATAEFLMEAAAWMESVMFRATALVAEF